MGIPMYGQTFTLGTRWDTNPDLLDNGDSMGLNIPAISGGEPGEYTRAKGFLAYYEVGKLIKHCKYEYIHRYGHTHGVLFKIFINLQLYNTLFCSRFVTVSKIRVGMLLKIPMKEWVLTRTRVISGFHLTTWI